MKELACGSIGFFVGIILMVCVSVSRDERMVANWRAEAVKAGSAEWVAGEDGSAEFRWRTER